MKYISLLVFLMMSCNKAPKHQTITNYMCSYPFGPHVTVPANGVTETSTSLMIETENSTIIIPKSLCIAVVDK